MQLIIFNFDAEAYSMKSSDIYLLELNIKKCKININDTGSVGLLLRAGKSQSHVTELKPIMKGVINFNTRIRLNIDSNALDTQRCSLTLNFVSAENIRRIIGIVVISLPQIGEEIQKTFKVTSTPDKQAEIQLSISVNELDSNLKPKSKQPEKSSLKMSEKGNNPQNLSQKQLSSSQKQKFVGQPLLLMANKSQQKPTSPPSESNKKLNLKSKISEPNPEKLPNNENLIKEIQKLKKEKELLKQLLKLEIQKNQKTTNHFKNIVEVLHLSIGFNFSPFLQQDSLRNRTTLNSLNQKGVGKSEQLKTTLGMENHTYFSDITKQKKVQEFFKFQADSAKNSHITFGKEKNVDIAGILTQFKKKLSENLESKSEISKLFEKIRLQPQLTHDPQRMRVLKTKIDKSYLLILGKNSVAKEQILKHKIEINKLLDEFISPIVKK